ncbi:hypothetical protein [Bacillus sp. FJAT-27245]|uniref:hypothetical protein n=1 Tax=Bacillus sp. FJAT-27245 TaxID=1684144 RepID=UPI0006A77EDF|nr:hypothetical protein [Bacillus sp. FJAT-27245]
MKPFFYIVLLIVAVFIFYYVKNKPNSNRVNGDDKPVNSFRKTAEARVFDAKPDMPVGFGYKSQWFVIKAENTDEVAKDLNLTNIQPANWSTGIEGAYDGYYFVAPPVRGWTIVANSLMPDMTDPTDENPLKTIQHLSKKYGEAYYFGTHRVVDYHAWGRAKNGEIIRAYGYLGESDEVLINKGEFTSEELKHNLNYTDLDNGEANFPDEEHVIILSKEWAIDPRLDYADLGAGVGLAGMKVVPKR